MAPRRSKKKEESEAEDYVEEKDLGPDEEDEEEVKPKKRAPARPARKRKPAVVEVDDDDDEEEEEVKPKKKRAPARKRKPKEPKEEEDDSEADPTQRGQEEPAKKKRTPAKPKRTEPFTTEDGWNAVPPGLLFKSNCHSSSTKVAAFDLDGTLVNLKSSTDPVRGPTTAEDYRFFNDTVIGKVKELHAEGYKLVIFSNQGGVKSALEGVMSLKVRQRADLILAELGCPFTVYYGTMKDDFRKPEKGMWDHFVQEFCSGKAPDLEASFFVGDAAGRIGDFADTDKGFAEAVGLPFKTPEDMFGESSIPKGSGDAGPDVPDGPNADMARAFHRLARLQEDNGANAFGIRAIKKVAGIIAEWDGQIKAGKELKDVVGVGKGSVAKINEFLGTGTLEALQAAGVPLTPLSHEEKVKVENQQTAFQFA